MPRVIHLHIAAICFRFAGRHIALLPTFFLAVVPARRLAVSRMLALPALPLVPACDLALPFMVAPFATLFVPHFSALMRPFAFDSFVLLFAAVMVLGKRIAGRQTKADQ